MKILVLFVFSFAYSCSSVDKIPVIENLPEDQECYSIGSAQGQSVSGGYEDAIHHAKAEANRINGTHIMIMRKYQDKYKDDSIKAYRKIYIVSVRVYECHPFNK